MLSPKEKTETAKCRFEHKQAPNVTLGKFNKKNTKLPIYLKAHIWKNRIGQPYYSDSSMGM